MGIMSSEWRGRLQHWMRTLKDDFYRPLGEISWEAFRTMDHLSQEEAMNGPFEPVEPGFTWGKTWEYCWFRGKVVLPAEAQGKRIVMDLKPDGESTLFVNGQEFGTYRASWVTQKHHFVEDNVLTTDAVAGTEYEILMETYALLSGISGRRLRNRPGTSRRISGPAGRGQETYPRYLHLRYLE